MVGWTGFVAYRAPWLRALSTDCSLSGGPCPRRALGDSGHLGSAVGLEFAGEQVERVLRYRYFPVIASITGIIGAFVMALSWNDWFQVNRS